MRIIFILLAVVITGSAQAGTFSIKPNEPKQISLDSTVVSSETEENMSDLVMVSGIGKSSNNGRIINRGKRPAYVKEVPEQKHSFYEKTQTIKKALEHIVPIEFNVFTNDIKILEEKCGFSGSGEWDKVLADVLYNNEKGTTGNIHTTIDWNRKQVILRREVSKRAEGEFRGTAKRAEEEEETAKPVVAKGVVKYFDVKVSDGFLSKTLNRWCLEASDVCRQVRWNPDYEVVIEADAPKMGTDFISAVDAVFESLSTSIRGHRFYYRMAPNGVLIVSE